MASMTIRHGPGLSDSFVLDERSRTHNAEVRDGALSVKCMLKGGAWYELEGTRIRLEGCQYLLLNQGQPYRIEIDEVEPVESFCVFFGAGLVEDVWRARSASLDSLLEDPFNHGKPVGVADRLYPFDELVIPAQMRLRESVRSVQTQNADEGIRRLAEAVIESQGFVRKSVTQFSAARPATRHELYRRLHRARDYMDSHPDRSLNLAEAARAACLSPHHFHRAFRHAFHQTPHAYSIYRRLERARTLLHQTELPVIEICAEVGFESLPSFTALFKRYAGVTPGQFRKIR
jgi:AraC-like DNA-binding protein